MKLDPRAAIIRIPGPRNPRERDPAVVYRELLQCLQAMMINQGSNEVLQVIFNYVPLEDDITTGD
jgi:hypothetical protein